jgi:hypothetical protein
MRRLDDVGELQAHRSLRPDEDDGLFAISDRPQLNTLILGGIVQ